MKDQAVESGTHSSIHEDELLLARLITRYAVAVDERDWQGLERLFTHGARIDYTRALGPAGPIEEIVPWMEANLSWAVLPRCQHMVSNILTTIDGDEAKGRADYLNADVFASPAGELRLVLHGGVYRAEFRRESTWRISALLTEVIWRQEPSPDTTTFLYQGLENLLPSSRANARESV